MRGSIRVWTAASLAASRYARRSSTVDEMNT
jgi:hypothetical protein